MGTNKMIFYDNAYRLTGEARVSTNPLLEYTEEFSYDAMGNRTQRRKSVQGGPSVNTDYAYNAANQLISEFAGGTQTDYSYDDNGNLVQKQTGSDVTNYGFDSLDRMTSAVVNGVTSLYSYDVSGKRIRKNLVQSGQGVTEYWHQGDNVIAKFNPLAQTITATYNTPFLDENVSMNRNGQTYYYMQDGLGSVRQLLNSSTQEPVNSYDYNAWGESVNEQELVPNTFKYTGREWDNETGQYNYRSRYYNPANGRFNQKDTIGFDGGFNLYAYVNNNPMKFTDPLGLDKERTQTDVSEHLAKQLLDTEKKLRDLNEELSIAVSQNPPNKENIAHFNSLIAYYLKLRILEQTDIDKSEFINVMGELSCYPVNSNETAVGSKRQ
ncbi:MAG: RHS repeat-associated core domain-containing protein [Planctomycetes bacterium]|nr:RHS repeat-associated core domain-containing protein [Planctomycetota bacterium]